MLDGGVAWQCHAFLSRMYLTQKAVGQFRSGPRRFLAGSTLIILLMCFILYNWMQRLGTADAQGLVMNEN